MGTRSIKAPLSPHEELTLRRIAIGIATIEELPESELARLRSGGLLDDVNRLTPAGQERYDSLHQPRPSKGTAQKDTAQKDTAQDEIFRAALRRAAHTSHQA